MYKTETHLHTSPVSPCGQLTAREMVRRYHEAGFTTVFISDHFERKVLDMLGDNLSWDEQIDAFLRGYEEALGEGQQLGMHVLLSAEIALNGDHFLLYGIDPDFLRAREDIFDFTPAELYAYAHAHGVTVVQAHPLRDMKCTPHPDAADAFEAFNTNPRHANYDDEVAAIAAAHHLPLTAGSDAHRTEDVGRGAMLSDEPVTSGQQYAQWLLAGKMRPMKEGCAQ